MKELLQVKKTEIITGLSKEYKLIQLSDMHMACLDKDSSEVDKQDHARVVAGWTPLKYEMARDASEFCDERYDIEANVLFEALTDYAKSAKADALIFSGDMLDRITESNIRYMSAFLKSYPIPVVYCPGNHAWINEAGDFGVVEFFSRPEPYPVAPVDLVARVEEGARDSRFYSRVESRCKQRVKSTV